MKTERNKGDHQFNCHVTAVFEGENIWLFFWASKNRAFGQVSAAMLSSAEFFILFYYGFVWKLARVALCNDLPCLQQKKHIQLSSWYLFMQICDTLFLASKGFHDIKTLRCSERSWQEQSKPNRDSEAHFSEHIGCGV